MLISSQPFLEGKYPLVTSIPSIFSGNMNFLHGFVFKCLHFQLILMIIIQKKKLQFTAENFVYTNLGGKKEDSVVFLSFIQ